MKLCKDLGLNPDTYSVSIPLGSTINMAGAAITINILTLAAVNTLGISVDFATAFVLSIVAAISACGASGIAGGSFLLIPVACSLFGISAGCGCRFRHRCYSRLLRNSPQFFNRCPLYSSSRIFLYSQKIIKTSLFRACFIWFQSFIIGNVSCLSPNVPLNSF